jgi:hypothetical protein
LPPLTNSLAFAPQFGSESEKHEDHLVDALAYLILGVASDGTKLQKVRYVYADSRTRA